MVYMVVTTTYPSHKEDEVGEKYIEVLKKYPPDRSLGKQVVPLAVKPAHDGMKAMSIIDVKEGKIGEALNLVVRMLSEYLSIEGYEYAIDIWATQAEAMEFSGMTLPGQ
jgi:hypothetical protein